MRTSAHGFTVGRGVALASLPPDVDTGARVSVDVLGEPAAAEVAKTVLYDPENTRVRDRPAPR